MRLAGRGPQRDDQPHSMCLHETSYSHLCDSMDSRLTVRTVSKKRRTACSSQHGMLSDTDPRHRTRGRGGLRYKCTIVMHVPNSRTSIWQCSATCPVASAGAVRKQGHGHEHVLHVRAETVAAVQAHIRLLLHECWLPYLDCILEGVIDKQPCADGLAHLTLAQLGASVCTAPNNRVHTVIDVFTTHGMKTN